MGALRCTARCGANDRLKRVLVDKLEARYGEDLRGRNFAQSVLTFKPSADDMRETPRRTVVAALTTGGAVVQA